MDLEVNWPVFNIRTNNSLGLVVSAVRFLVWVVLFHFGLKARAKVGAMNDEDLSNFFVEVS